MKLIQGAHSFLIEFLYRLRTKSPKFFYVLSWIMAVLLVIAKIPYALKHWLNIEVASNFVEMGNDIAWIAGGFFAATVLPVKSPPVAQTKDGQPITVTDEKKMPFTAKSEEKQVEESVPPPPVVNVPENKP